MQLLSITIASAILKKRVDFTIWNISLKSFVFDNIKNYVTKNTGKYPNFMCLNLLLFFRRPRGVDEPVEFVIIIFVFTGRTIFVELISV